MDVCLNCSKIHLTSLFLLLLPKTLHTTFLGQIFIACTHRALSPYTALCFCTRANHTAPHFQLELLYSVVIQMKENVLAV